MSQRLLLALLAAVVVAGTAGATYGALDLRLDQATGLVADSGADGISAPPPILGEPLPSQDSAGAAVEGPLTGTPRPEPQPDPEPVSRPRPVTPPPTVTPPPATTPPPSRPATTQRPPPPPEPTPSESTPPACDPGPPMREVTRLATRCATERVSQAREACQAALDRANAAVAACVSSN